ncbi:hypothetical protein TTHERM_000526629 (macronuclear) [Tetrahymena thermophila SB210]|uniref:Uncharacterized protein n=1 Tax=Tetrahymena thermophila (strain SB210) TaxID=312017 RepID=W7XDR8_TETTS|nr:hypothetical protein TTHERM_000526629 [Tetrahymena thermophila SB210]EWS70924.1 hypothetical protein TTHERM_000526629 [Tetrahymena thermophila SB210]|eukprot:XP_012656539.1 hypothetical protein TTHERM_000526629 [Tetrahymena thermophila SB210]
MKQKILKRNQNQIRRKFIYLVRRQNNDQVKETSKFNRQNKRSNQIIYFKLIKFLIYCYKKCKSLDKGIQQTTTSKKSVGQKNVIFKISKLTLQIS